MKGSTSIKGDSEFAKLLEESFKSEKKFKEGSVVIGTIVKVEKEFALIDIGFKSEGIVPIYEFYTLSNELNAKIGSEHEFFIEEIEDENGRVVLSKDKADKMKIWDRIAQSYEKEEIIEGRVIDKVKGGLAVDIGVKAFLPGSQIDLSPVRNMDELLNKVMKFKIIKFNKKTGNIVLSRRVLLEKEREVQRQEMLSTLEEGAVVEGVIKNITDYGAFIDLGGLDGLLHITDMSWGRVNHPSSLFKVGDKLEVKILKYDAENSRVSLGLKQLTPDPWMKSHDKFPPGTRVKGKVASITDYGAFVELAEGIEGLIHVSEMSWTKKVKHPSRIVSVGDEVEAVVLEIDASQKKISLGMKQLQPNPWEIIAQKYPVGTKVNGTVKSITDFGVFIEVEDGIDGLVHISDISWSQKIKHPSEAFKKGDKVEAIVLTTDVENERFSLGVKQLSADPWKNARDKFTSGTKVTGNVTKVADFGVFVQLDKDIEGLIHISELKDEQKETMKETFKPGQSVEAVVISSDIKERKIGLSIKALETYSEKADVDQFIETEEKRKAQLGDFFKKEDLENLKKKTKKETTTEES